MIKIEHDGDTWNIVAEGVTRDGKTLCHLASTTRFRQQKSGPYPIQISDWIENERILSAAMRHEEESRRLSGALNPWRGRGPDPRRTTPDE